MSRREHHIRELADRMGVALRLAPEPAPHPDTGVLLPYGSAGSIFGLIDVHVGGWDDGKVAYFAALHELGHVGSGHLLPGAPSPWSSEVVETEAEAWDWALRHAQEEPDEEVRFHIRQHYLGSYARHNPVSQGYRRGPVFHRLNSDLGLELV